MIEPRAEALAGRPRAQQPRVHVALLVGVGRERALAGLHRVDEVEGVGRAERAPVEPIVGLPHVDHGVEGDGGREGRVRLAQGGEGQPARIGGPPDPDPAIVAGDLLDQPVDGVPGVRGLVRLGAVEGAPGNAIHGVVALGLEASPEVLDGEDVGSPQVPVAEGDVEPRGGPPAEGAGRVVRGALEQDGQRSSRALRGQDQGVELHPVAHGDSFLADREVVARVHFAQGLIGPSSASGQDRDGKGEHQSGAHGSPDGASR